MKITRNVSVVLGVASMALTAVAAHIGGSPDYDLLWHTIDSGGGTSSGGGITLSGTIAQFDAGLMSGGEYSLAGGFWNVEPEGGPHCPADFDGSGDVGVGDLLQLLAAWGCSGACPEDIDGSGMVDFGDLLQMLAAWGPCE